MAKRKYGSGLAGYKDNGKWGILSGKEIIDRLLSGDITPETAKRNMTKKQENAVNKEYKRYANAVKSRERKLNKYLKDSDLRSWAHDNLQFTGGQMPTEPPRDLDELLKQFTRAEQYLADPTSIPEGIEREYEEFERNYESTSNYPDYSERSESHDEYEDLDENYGRPNEDFMQGDFSEENSRHKWRDYTANDKYVRDSAIFNYYRRILNADPNILEKLGTDSDGLMDLIAEALYENEVDPEQWIIDFLNEHENDSYMSYEDYKKQSYPVT